MSLNRFGIIGLLVLSFMLCSVPTSNAGPILRLLGVGDGYVFDGRAQRVANRSSARAGAVSTRMSAHRYCSNCHKTTAEAVPE